MSYIHVLRGGLLESRHRVHAAVVRPDGSLLASVGDPHFVTFLRSNAKPFQAQALIPHLERYGLESKHLAIAIASHSGDATHVATVRDLQDKTGVNPDWLVCGLHTPLDPETRNQLRANNQKPNVWQNNCSGKHTGMLAASLANGWPTAGYAQPTHPVQEWIQTALRGISATPDLGVAIDGCSVPSFRMPLLNAALSMARLAYPSAIPAHQAGLEAAYQAMRAHPHLIAGHGRIDTLLMQNLPNLVSKTGAEALIGVGIRESAHGPLGITIKIEDGSERARDVAVTHLLGLLGLGVQQHPALAALSQPSLKNLAGLEVGSLQADFDLDWA